AAVSQTTLQAACQQVALMRQAGRTISFDTNLRPTLWKTPELMRHWINHLAVQADWVLPGIDEGRLLTGEASPEGIARFYLDRGAQLVVVKLGADGAYFEGCHEGVAMRGYVPGFPVAQVVDTVGAGDGFAVGLVSALLEGCSLPDAVKRGAWIGARAVQVPGDTEGLPTRIELDAAAL
ncbi:MAG TPA: PfkB family carbohydrate kinase, partial [Noviherbaspirillum sp.]